VYTYPLEHETFNQSYASSYECNCQIRTSFIKNKIILNSSSKIKFLLRSLKRLTNGNLLFDRWNIRYSNQAPTIFSHVLLSTSKFHCHSILYEKQTIQKILSISYIAFSFLFLSFSFFNRMNRSLLFFDEQEIS
jgi:hypothetical protein